MRKFANKNTSNNVNICIFPQISGNILDRLVYPYVDNKLSDANVVSRKGQNIRENLFVLNAVLNSVSRDNEEPCDVGVYDITKAIDSLWAQDCLNDLYDNGYNNDKLYLLHLGTRDTCNPGRHSS